MSDSQDPVSATTPGWRTTEFYFKVVAAALTLGYASGLIPTTGTVAAVAAMAATLLAALGYTVSRTLVKTNAARVAGATTTTVLNVSPAATDVQTAPGSVAAALKAQAGHVTFGAMLVLIVSMTLGGVAMSLIGSCNGADVKTTLKNEGQAVAKGTVQCLTPDIQQITGQFGPLVDALLDKATGGDRSLDLETVKSGARNLKGDALGCLMASSVSRLLLAIQHGVAPGTASAPLLPSEAALKDVWAKLKAENFEGKDFQLEAGTI